MSTQIKTNPAASAELEYSNACNLTGILVPFGHFQLRVWLDCLVYFDAKYEAHDEKDRLITGQFGEWELNFTTLDLYDPRLSVWVVDLQGEDVCQLFDNTLDGKDYSKQEVAAFLRMPVDVTNGREVTLMEVLKEVVENEGPNQDSKNNSLDDWIDAVEESQ